MPTDTLSSLNHDMIATRVQSLVRRKTKYKRAYVTFRHDMPMTDMFESIGTILRYKISLTPNRAAYIAAHVHGNEDEEEITRRLIDSLKNTILDLVHTKIYEPLDT